MKFFRVGEYIINIANILYVEINTRDENGAASSLSVYFAGGGREDIYSYITLRDAAEFKDLLLEIGYSDD